MIFTEKSIGTNAVDLSIRLNKSVYVPAKDNYCDFLKTWDVFSVPLLNGEETMGYLAVIMPEKKISKEMIAVTGLLGYRIANEYTQGLKRDCRDKISGVRLTNRQLIILKHLACGKTDKALAIELKLNFGTIKYHKRNIFKKLKVSCNVEAVIKALKLGLISLEQIDL